jgi:hypothetical protein
MNSLNRIAVSDGQIRRTSDLSSVGANINNPAGSNKNNWRRRSAALSDVEPYRRKLSTQEVHQQAIERQSAHFHPLSRRSSKHYVENNKSEVISSGKASSYPLPDISSIPTFPVELLVSQSH